MSQNYERIQVVIEGPKKGPFMITLNDIIMKDDILSTTAKTVKVKDYVLTWNEDK